jgi:hypothetical protein
MKSMKTMGGLFSKRAKTNLMNSCKMTAWNNTLLCLPHSIATSHQNELKIVALIHHNPHDMIMFLNVQKVFDCIFTARL